MPTTEVTLSEWESRDPGNEPRLRGVWLPDAPRVRAAADDLARCGVLKLTELKTGTSVTAFSYVGRVRLGDLEVTVRPKIDGLKLLTLLRYAYGLRDIRLVGKTAYHHQSHAFQDLIIEQLAAEAQELLSRGLYRRYVRRSEELPSPRGRIDVQQVARRGPAALRSALPCVHHPRTEDCIENQILMAGLQLATRLAIDPNLRSRVRLLVKLLDQQVSHVVLDLHALEQLDRHRNRLTATYTPALNLIRILLEGHGVALADADRSTVLAGFMFDMNRFYQALLLRFLRENLFGFTLHDEFSLRGIMAYVPGANPRNRQPPRPRPDFVVADGSTVVAILDAKYRDLWETTLPREMLYQLAIYATSQSTCRSAAILYPTLSKDALEARVAVRDPLSGFTRAVVILRPVNLDVMAGLVSAAGVAGERARGRLASSMCFGAPAESFNAA